MLTSEEICAKYGLISDAGVKDTEMEFLKDMQEEILQGDPLRAIEMLDFDMEMRNQIPATNWALRGLANLSLGKYSEAINDASEALRIDPGFVRAYDVQAEAYLRMGKGKDALHAADMALVFNYDDSWAIGIRAAACYLLHYFDEAIDSANRALEAKPNWLLPREALALSYYRLGCSDDSISEANKLLDLNPDNTVAHRILNSIQRL